MKSLTSSELQFANQVIMTGMTKAAESLSFFMKENIQFQSIDFQYIESNKIELKIEKENINLLSTEVKGELKGFCCLLFNQNEAKKIIDIVLPNELRENEEMREAVLLEIDNIIAASVISQFANLLKTNIYGNVPNLKVVNQDFIKKYIQDYSVNMSYVFNFKTHFKSNEESFSPTFFWFLNEQFVLKIREITFKTNS